MTTEPWPFRDAIVAVERLRRDDFSRMEGADADEFETCETIMALCELFVQALAKADPAGFTASVKSIKELNLK